MLTTLEERQVRTELEKSLDITGYLMKSIEDAILSTDSGDDKLAFHEIYGKVVEARILLREAQSHFEDVAATTIQYLGQEIEVIE